MNIIEAIKSGKRFRRKSWDKDSRWREVIREPRCHHIGERADDIIADDWEIEEQKITITFDDLSNAFRRSCAHTGLLDVCKMAKELGFK